MLILGTFSLEIVSFLDSRMIRMSSEISQLCLEALSPLAEQCAKSQDKDTPLFIATRHFLKVHHGLVQGRKRS